jgi:hypothetical protein
MEGVTILPGVATPESTAYRYIAIAKAKTKQRENHLLRISSPMFGGGRAVDGRVPDEFGTQPTEE